ncbi:MAG: hypothetical protein WAZ27_01380 [Minisyncoccia bacterium]
MHKRRHRIFLLTFLIALPFVVASAQEEVIGIGQYFPDEVLAEIAADSVPPNTVSCFDYYTFGSVRTDLSAPTVSAVSGTDISFSGTISNDNSYPIVDGALYVKILRSRGGTNDGNGPDVVDQFAVKGDIVLPAKGTLPISFQWKIPSYAVTGEYEIATFFTTSRKFNLLGLSFTDDVVGERVPFQIIGDQEKVVGFDKSGVTIDGKPYLFASFPPRVSKTDPIDVSALVRNTLAQTQEVTILWTVYQWDAQLRENVVHEESVRATIPANSSQKVSLTVQDASYPVYFVTGSLRWKDTKSIIGARFVREGVDRTRINFPGVTAFPLVKGEENTLFSCLHNSGASPLVSGGSLDLTITDREGNLIHEYRYDGDVTGDMMGVASKFVPEKSYDYFRLTARLYQDGAFLDEANLEYDCEQINPGLCNRDMSTESDNSLKYLMMLVLGVAALLIIAFVVRRFSMRRQDAQLPPL